MSSWTQQDSDTVRQLSAAGVSRSQIASAVGCSRSTLRRCFAPELASAGAEREPQIRRQVSLLGGLGLASSDVATALGVTEARLSGVCAMDHRRARVLANALPAVALLKRALDGDVSAQIFWLKYRAGWAEKGGANASAQSEEGERQAALRADIKRLSSEGRKALRLVLTELGATSTLTDMDPED